MAENGTATFASPEDYCAAISAMTASLVVTGRGEFTGRLTWLNLGHLHILRSFENLPRIGFFSLSPARVFVSFPTNADSSLHYSGQGLQLGEIVFHKRGEKSHQRTHGDGQWGLISLQPEQLAACGEALTGLGIVAPRQGLILRPSRSAARRLLRLHAKACRLAETRPELIAYPEVARAIEQELLHALVNCLTTKDASSNLDVRRRHTEVMTRFQDALAKNGHRRLNIPELCSSLGVPERTLRACCTEFTGMSSDSVSSVTTTEHGAIGIAPRGSGNRKHRRDRPNLPIPAARTFCRGLSQRLRRDAVLHIAASTDQSTLSELLPKSHSARASICENGRID